MQLLIAGGGVFNGGDNRLQLFVRFLKFIGQFDDLIESSALFLGPASPTKSREQFIGCRNRRGTKLDRFVLFYRNKKMPVLVEEQVPLGDAAEAPAFMQTKSSGFEFIELLSGFCS